MTHPPRAAPPGAGEKPRLAVVDGLRGCAVLGVLLLHFTEEASRTAGSWREVYQVLGLGWTGVDLFFVLSGFLITGILADSRERPDRYRNFYLRRAVRILPPYYAFLLILFGVPYLFHAPAHLTAIGDQLPYWLYYQNFRPLANRSVEFAAHLWTLAIEEQFYLVWPPVILLLSRRQALWVCLGCVVVAIAFRIACVAMVDDLRVVYFYTPGRMDALAIGAAVALMARGPDGLRGLRAAAPRVGLAATAVLAGATLHPSGFNPAGIYMVTVGYSATALLFGSVLVLALERPLPALERLLTLRALRFLGFYSYGLYLVHLPLNTLARRAGITPDALDAAGMGDGLFAYVGLLLAASLLVAMVSWRFLERPFLKLRPGSLAGPAPTVPGPP